MSLLGEKTHSKMHIAMLVVKRACLGWTSNVLIVSFGEAIAASGKALHAILVPIVAAPASLEIFGNAADEARLVQAISLASSEVCFEVAVSNVNYDRKSYK